MTDETTEVAETPVVETTEEVVEEKEETPEDKNRAQLYGQW